MSVAVSHFNQVRGQALGVIKLSISFFICPSVFISISISIPTSVFIYRYLYTCGIGTGLEMEKKLERDMEKNPFLWVRYEVPLTQKSTFGYR